MSRDVCKAMSATSAEPLWPMPHSQDEKAWISLISMLVPKLFCLIRPSLQLLYILRQIDLFWCDFESSGRKGLA